MLETYNRSRAWIYLLPALLISFFGVTVQSSAQEKYPDRPITIVAPFPPGGVADLTARPVAAARCPRRSDDFRGQREPPLEKPQRVCRRRQKAPGRNFIFVFRRLRYAA